jgi:uncharacterized protein (TIGR03435 family)
VTSRSGKSTTAAVFVLLLLALPLRAQLPTISDVDPGSHAPATGPLPQWDVAVVKPHAASDGNMSWQMTDDGLSLVNLPLEQMICSGWDLKPYQVSTSIGWIKSTGFDLTAKVSGDDVAAYKKLNVAQHREMLQKLLIDRFQMKLHMETKTLPVYDLVVDKGGSKLKPSTVLVPSSPEEAKANPEKYKKSYGMSMGPGMFEGTGVTTRALASQLANALGRPVRDQTGLTGTYDISLHFQPQQEAAAVGNTGDAPSIFSAVQELGLKLVPDKGPVETLVVDAAQNPLED